MTSSSGDAQYARRALSALLFSVFGAVWLQAWAMQRGAPAAVHIGLVVLGLSLAGTAFVQYRRNYPALAAAPQTAQRRRVRRMFHMVNAGQWVLIVIVGNVLANVGLERWVVPMVIGVVGLHFVPLAYVFHNRAHYVTAAAMTTFAVLYPLAASDGPRNPVGFLGAGLILWASAVSAIVCRTERGHVASDGTARTP